MSFARVLHGGADRPLSEQIYGVLREQIISGVLAPDQRLVERDLAAALDVSRMPLREALPQLEADGFIRILPRRGAVVTRLTLRDIEELFDVRESLEVLAAKLAARHAEANPDAPGIASMADYVTQARDNLACGNDRGAAAANAAFHQALVQLPEHRLLTRMMAPLAGRLEWLFRLTADRDIHGQCTEHEAMLTAIRAGNTDLAGALAFAHVASGREPSLRSLADVLPAE